MRKRQQEPQRNHYSPHTSYTANFTNILCNGDNNGTITISPTGGTPAYTYQWAPAQPNDSALTGLAAGNYAA